MANYESVQGCQLTWATVNLAAAASVAKTINIFPKAAGRRGKAVNLAAATAPARTIYKLSKPAVNLAAAAFPAETIHRLLKPAG